MATSLFAEGAVAARPSPDLLDVLIRTSAGWYAGEDPCRCIYGRHCWSGGTVAHLGVSRMAGGRGWRSVHHNSYPARVGANASSTMAAASPQSAART